MASSIPYLAKFLPHQLHFMTPKGLGRWRLEAASGFPYLGKLLPLPASWCSPPCARTEGGLRGLGRRRLEVASGFPYLAKLLSPPASCTHLHAPTFMHSPSCTHLHAPIFHAALPSCSALVDGGLEVASGFPYLAKLLHLTSFMRPPLVHRRGALVDGDWKWHLAFPI